ncbi:unnamed protein product [Rotaria sp. Silwood2]|nr:unnamed protein product [Rotaria sp. Silwood2]CAF3326500.1 unnamed protein product [Rotaria sp. Silwood2]CAF4057201.1 unnamed protein product [Rotaria sp. Silwood2]CAF4193595.1 unnamed protein product [Rotaria sp. Silwood2]CAF4408306.1 unnamed protein product [Rotaria sp. Silwood2]
MFKTDISSFDYQRRRTEILTTRLYLILLAFFINILIVYNAIGIRSKQIIISNPSQVVFDFLQSNSNYSATLQCPCRNVTMPYNLFVSISPCFHQICSSDFVIKNSDWMNLVYNKWATLTYSYDDFRLFVVPQFQWLSLSCTLANTTLTDAINEFLLDAFISVRVESRKTIEMQVNNSLTQFCLSTPRTFVRMLDFIRNVSQGNWIVSSIRSNWYFMVSTPADSEMTWNSLWAKPRFYNNGSCSCGTSSMCSSPAAIDGRLVPGFRVGCFPLEALLQSTLECLYDITCINMLQSMYTSSNLIYHPLNSTISASNTTVQSLVSELMVDRWETSMNYTGYYASCAPVLCTYSINEKGDLIYIITTILSIYGGLNVALKLFTPLIVKFGRFLLMRHRRQVQPIVATIEMHE